MPPFLPRKRPSPPPPDKVLQTRAKRPKLADALDAESVVVLRSSIQAGAFSLGNDSDSSLSDVDSDEFEDVPARVQKSYSTSQPLNIKDDPEEEDDVEWEDAAAPPSALSPDEDPAKVSLPDGPIQLTFRKDEEGYDYSATVAASGQKKGPTRREKQARLLAHQMHVQFLMFHNAIRNSWISDKIVHQTLLKQLPDQIANEVEKWKVSSGFVLPDTEPPKDNHKKKRRKGQTDKTKRGERDWGQPSQRLEVGKPDMSHGDPIIALLKILIAYWKKRFVVTNPGLRKRGYTSKQGLRQMINSYRHDEHDPQRHGERIRDIEEYRQIAVKCEGSRDICAQMFTALLRALGIEARMVASLQPCGYGFTKAEQMSTVQTVTDAPESSNRTSSEGRFTSVAIEGSRSQKQEGKSTRRRSQIAKFKVIDLDTDAEDDLDLVSDTESVIELSHSSVMRRSSKFDRDLAYPIYWTEVISPITNRVLPVSPVAAETAIALTPETIAMFEPRGAKAEKARQVMAYVVAHSSDGTAKEVTIRYLRKRIWPGKTKGFRVPVEKVPIYDKKGRLKGHTDYDWFKYIMSMYGRSDTMRTAADDIEEATELMPQQAEKKGDDSTETLQSLKASADFVLERFLRREEALRPGAQPVRKFVSGKGDKYKEEDVYRRSDVERCLTAESWHKEGRRPKFGENAMKFVPVRAVTLTRKREAEEHERQTGEKQMQGLYSLDQTEYIIPPPIVDGVIPKNIYGNMDCFAPSMVPRGAVHIPLKGTVRICKRLDIDFAEAVTGFEFGNKRAVPVCTGVVVAQENEKVVRDAWEEWNIEQQRKQETKMEALVLGLWRKFIMGLRIRERIVDEYGTDIDLNNTTAGFHKDDPIALDNEDETERPNAGGGFVNEDVDMGGGFLMPHEDDVSEAEDLVVDHGPSGTTKAHGASRAQDFSAPLKLSNNDSAGLSNMPLTESHSSTDSGSSDNEEIKTDATENEDEPMDFAPRNSVPRLKAIEHRARNLSDEITPFEDEQSEEIVELEAKQIDRRIRMKTSRRRQSLGRSTSINKSDGDDATGSDIDGSHESAELSSEAEQYIPRATRTRKSRGQAKATVSVTENTASTSRGSLKKAKSAFPPGQELPGSDDIIPDKSNARQTGRAKLQVSKPRRGRPRKTPPKGNAGVTSPYFQD